MVVGMLEINFEHAGIITRGLEHYRAKHVFRGDKKIGFRPSGSIPFRESPDLSRKVSTLRERTGLSSCAGRSTFGVRTFSGKKSGPSACTMKGNVRGRDFWGKSPDLCGLKA